MIDFTIIQTDLEHFRTRFDVQDIAFDQFGTIQIAGAPTAKGLPGVLMLKHAKTVTPGCRELETRLKHGKFRHDGNSCLTWMASNVVVERRVDTVCCQRSKNKFSPNKIDGIDALVSDGAVGHGAADARERTGVSDRFVRGANSVRQILLRKAEPVTKAPETFVIVIRD